MKSQDELIGSKEEHEELDDLNNNFSKRLDKMKYREAFISKEVTISEEKDKLNKTKTCCNNTGRREDESDSDDFV
ncbi:hypothetical protein C1646_760642 [Rhizophagus diaphanus]|nr:hypothetical protein C1646_760642 [Rhizophagus diaphanus] [Rhizophagus sp. MUCL 43196]